MVKGDGGEQCPIRREKEDAVGRRIERDEEGRRQTDGLPIRWCGARAENLPFDAASFDGALLFTTLEFVHDPVRALQEAMQVIRDASVAATSGS